MIPLDNLSIYDKSPARLDSDVPQYVKMELSYDLELIPDKYRQEWDHIVENDVLFLLSIQVGSPWNVNRERFLRM